MEYNRYLISAVVINFNSTDQWLRKHTIAELYIAESLLHTLSVANNGGYAISDFNIRATATVAASKKSNLST